MVSYVIKRLLQFIPSFILITLLGFLLNTYAPIDGAERQASIENTGGRQITGAQADALLRNYRHKFGLDLPLFYFSVKADYECDTLERIPNRTERETLKKLNESCGDWELVSKYYLAVKEYLTHFDSYEKWTSLGGRPVCAPASSDSLEYTNGIQRMKIAQENTQSLLTTTDTSLIKKSLHIIDSVEAITYFSQSSPLLKSLQEAYLLLQNPEKDITLPYPSISFHGDNQYHRWLFGDGETSKGILRGDFGFSYSNGQPVGTLIASRIGYTLFFSLTGIFLAYLISIPLGVYAAVKKDSWFDRVSSVVLFLLYSLPSFWLATLLLVGFANPDVLYWFEQSGVKPAQGYPDGAGLFEKLRISLPYIVLPLICYTYSSLAFLSRTLRVSVLENIKQDYITTARAKGLPENKVIWRHAFRNSLLPLITVLANVFPYAIGGSVILETVFTLPGMGFETYRAILNQDYPVIMAMLTLTAVLTIVGLLVQDILYAIADPRISFSKRN